MCRLRGADNSVPAAAAVAGAAGAPGPADRRHVPAHGAVGGRHPARGQGPLGVESRRFQVLG